MNRTEVEAQARALDERELAPDDFERRLQGMLADSDEMAERAALMRWFMRRYPTARERLAYARRKVRELHDSPLVVRFDGDAGSRA